MPLVPSCPFCAPPSDRVVFEADLVRALWDGHPVSDGHLLLVTRRHIATWFDATAEEQAALTSELDRARQAITARHSPDGFNIGINVGEAAGQTIPHLHVHLIPRYRNDVADPRGGVRYVIPHKANYIAREAAPAPARTLEQAKPTPRLIHGGEDDPLFPHLVDQLAQARDADLAVGFVLGSGVTRIERHLQDLLERGGRLRLLTGDYLGVTDPDALTRLLDLGLAGHLVLRVFETVHPPPLERPSPSATVSFHPKAYVLHGPDGAGVAFVGSSNLSETALLTGIEWNYRVVSSAEGSAFQQIVASFEQLFSDPAVVDVTPDWIDRYRQRRPLLPATAPIEIAPEPDYAPPEPHGVQVEALAALARTREQGYRAGLVVMATGLGKTWLAAFDTAPFARVLFVAHREEILDQSLRTFRRIRPRSSLGFYRGQEREQTADVLFASIQMLGKAAHLDRFSRDHFDYIVVDEFHHAAAPTYRRLIQHFQPKFLLGLTATPERSDGGDLLALCQENLVYRCDLVEGVRQNLLCRFQYFGVPDEVDYRNIPWRNARFDTETLTTSARRGWRDSPSPCIAC